MSALLEIGFDMANLGMIPALHRCALRIACRSSGRYPETIASLFTTPAYLTVMHICVERQSKNAMLD